MGHGGPTGFTAAGFGVDGQRVGQLAAVVSLFEVDRSAAAMRASHLLVIKESNCRPVARWGACIDVWRLLAIRLTAAAAAFFHGRRLILHCGGGGGGGGGSGRVVLAAGHKQ